MPVEGRGELMFGVLVLDEQDDPAQLCGVDRPFRLHLFTTAPGRFALLLGHYWDCLTQSVTSEWLGIGAGYASAVRVPA